MSFDITSTSRISLFARIFSALIFLRPYISRFRRLIIVNVVLVFCAAAFESVGIGILVPILQTIDDGGVDNPFVKYARIVFEFLNIDYKFISLFSVFIVLILIKYAFVFLQQHYSRVLSATVTCYLRNSTLENMMDVSLEYYYKQKIGNIISTYFVSTQNVGALFEHFSLLTRGLFFTVTYIVLASIISWQLTLIVLFFVVIAYGFIRTRFRLGTEYGRIEKVLMDSIHATLQDRLAGIKIIKSYCAEKVFQREMDGLVADFRDNCIKIMDNKIVTFMFFEPVMFLLMALAVLFAVEVVKLPLVMLLVAIFVFMQIVPQFKVVNANLLAINELLPHLSKVVELLNREDKTYITAGNVEVDAIHEGIEFNGVYYYYAGTSQDVLKNISFKIPKNTTCALVGSSGGGKTTLVDLILRHHVPAKGSILVDGVDLKSITNSSWKKIIGLVDQDSHLFHDTIAGNIRFGTDAVSMADIRESAVIANAHGFIDAMSEKYETVVGQRGVCLSGGQKQRVALARALVRKPKLLILDEATSALDSEAEKLIQDALLQFKGKITIIIIAHRLSTIRHADQIVFMENGEIREQGTHDQLMKRKGRYCDYINLQNTSHDMDRDEEGCL